MSRYTTKTPITCTIDADLADQMKAAGLRPSEILTDGVRNALDGLDPLTVAERLTAVEKRLRALGREIKRVQNSADAALDRLDTIEQLAQSDALTLLDEHRPG